MDIAIVCPDVVKYLEKLDKNYKVLGNVIYDSDVFITKKNIDDVNIIGYMNRRNEQVEILNKVFNNEKKLVSIFPSGMAYALEAEKIDAGFVDCLTYLNLKYDGKTITNNMPTQTIIMRKDIEDVELVKRFIKIYNEKIKRFNENENNLIDVISKEINVENKEEILKKWKELQIRFAYLKEIE